MKRDSWMLDGDDGKGSSKINPLNGIFGGGDTKKKDTKATFIKPGSSSREANPYFKNGGTGLPPAAPSSEVKIAMPTLVEPTVAPASGGETLNKLTAQKLKAEMKGDATDVARLEKKIARLSGASSLFSVPEASAPSALKDSFELMRKDLVEERQASLAAKQLEAKEYAKSLVNDNYDRDEDFGSYTKGSSSGSNTTPGRDIKSKYFQGQVTQEKIERECAMCYESPLMDKNLLVAMGTLVMLMVPKTQLLGDLHFRIVPIQHISTSLVLEDDVWCEMRNFKKCLLRMSASLDREIIFLESVLDPEDKRHHCFVDAVVLPRGQHRDLRAYYKKALQECDEEWSTHNGIIDTELKGGLRRSIPKNFPFVYVDFRLDQGYVHLIENERRIGRDFLPRITLPLLYSDASGMLGEYRKSMPSKEYVKNALKTYEPFDWTPMLNEA